MSGREKSCRKIFFQQKGSLPSQPCWTASLWGNSTNGSIQTNTPAFQDNLVEYSACQSSLSAVCKDLRLFSFPHPFVLTFLSALYSLVLIFYKIPSLTDETYGKLDCSSLFFHDNSDLLCLLSFSSLSLSLFLRQP